MLLLLINRLLNVYIWKPIGICYLVSPLDNYSFLLMIWFFQHPRVPGDAIVATNYKCPNSNLPLKVAFIIFIIAFIKLKSANPFQGYEGLNMKTLQCQICNKWSSYATANIPHRRYQLPVSIIVFRLLYDDLILISCRYHIAAPISLPFFQFKSVRALYRDIYTIGNSFTSA